MIETLLASLTDGLLIGVVYGIAAMGLTLIFGVMNVINLAHGPIIALGMFAVYLFFTKFGLNPYVALIPTGLIGLVLGVIIYAVAVNRVIDAPHLSSLLATFSVNMIIIGLGTAIWTTTFYNVDTGMGTLTLGPVTAPLARFVSALAALAVTVALYLFLQRTRLGKYVRAVANNRTSAGLVGIPSTRVLAFTFGIGAALAMIAGGLIAISLPFTILTGGTYELKSFVIVVLGGLGNPVGALIGGLVLGLIEGIVPVFMKTTWVPVLEYVLFVLILLVRPQGLLGAKR